MSKRRALLLALLMSGICAGPPAVLAQSAQPHRVGVVYQGPVYAAAVDGLRDGLKGAGLEQGKDFLLHVRDVRDPKGAEVAARGLEEERVKLIFAVTTTVTLAARRATKDVPIVFYAGANPVSVGLVSSYRKPGGRLTGVNSQSGDLAPKRLQLLKEMLPKLRRVVTFYNPTSLVAKEAIGGAREAARHLQVELVERPVASVEDLREALRSLRTTSADAYLQVPDALVNSQSPLIIEAARAQKLPTMFTTTGAVTGGGLASYGVSYYEIGRLAAKHVQRVLLGADPASLPVEQVDKLHFAINLKTARALGLTIPPAVLGRADEIIE